MSAEEELAKLREIKRLQEEKFRSQVTRFKEIYANTEENLKNEQQKNGELNAELASLRDTLKNQELQAQQSLQDAIGNGQQIAQQNAELRDQVNKLKEYGRKLKGRLEEVQREHFEHSAPHGDTATVHELTLKLKSMQDEKEMLVASLSQQIEHLTTQLEESKKTGASPAPPTQVGPADGAHLSAGTVAKVRNLQEKHDHALRQLDDLRKARQKQAKSVRAIHRLAKSMLQRDSLPSTDPVPTVRLNLTTDIDELQDQLDRLHQTVTLAHSSRAEPDTNSDELTQLQQELEDTKTQLTAAKREAELAAAASEDSERVMQKQLDELRLANDALSKQAEKDSALAQQSIVQREQELRSLLGQSQRETESTNAEHAAAMKDMEERVEQLETEYARKQQEANATISSLEKAKEDLATDLELVRSEFDERLQADAHASKNELETLRQEIKDLKTQLDTERESNLRETEEKDKIAQEIQNSSSDAASKIQLLQRELSLHNRQLTEVLRSQSDEGDAETRWNELRTKINRLRGALKTSNDKGQEYMNKLEKALGDVSEKNEEIAKLQSSFTELQTVVNGGKTSMEEQTKQHVQQIGELRKALDDAQTQIRSQEESTAGLTSDVARLEAAKKSLEEENSAVSEYLEDREDAIRGLEQKLAEMEAETVHQTGMAEELESLKKQLAQQEEQNETLQKGLIRIGDVKDSIEEELAEANEKIQGREEELSTMHAKSSELRSAFEELQRNQSELRRAHEQKLKDAEESRVKASSLEDELETARAELVQFSRQREEQQDSVAGEVSDLMVKLTAAHASIEELNMTVATKEQALEEMRSKVASFAGRVSDYAEIISGIKRSRSLVDAMIMQCMETIDETISGVNALRSSHATSESASQGMSSTQVAHHEYVEIVNILFAMHAKLISERQQVAKIASAIGDEAVLVLGRAGVPPRDTEDANVLQRMQHVSAMSRQALELAVGNASIVDSLLTSKQEKSKANLGDMVDILDQLKDLHRRKGQIIAESKRRASEHLGQIAVSSEELHTLKSRIGELRTSKEALEHEMQGQTSTFQDSFEVMQKMIDEMRAKLESDKQGATTEFAELTARLKAFEASDSEKEATIVSLRQSLSKAMAQASLIDTEQSTMLAPTSEVKAVNVEHDQLQQLPSEISETAKEDPESQQVLLLRRKLQESNERIEQLQNELGLLQPELEKLRRDNKTLASDKRAATAEVLSQIEDSEAKVAESQLKVAELEERISALNTGIYQERQQRMALQQANDAAKLAHDRMVSDIGETVGNIATVMDDEELQGIDIASSNPKDVMRVAVERLFLWGQSMKAATDESATTRDGLVQDLLNQLSVANGRIEAAEKARSNLQGQAQRNTEMEFEIQNLRAELAQGLQAQDAVNAELMDVRSDLSNTLAQTRKALVVYKRHTEKLVTERDQLIRDLEEVRSKQDEHPQPNGENNLASLEPESPQAAQSSPNGPDAILKSSRSSGAGISGELVEEYEEKIKVLEQDYVRLKKQSKVQIESLTNEIRLLKQSLVNLERLKEERDQDCSSRMEAYEKQIAEANGMHDDLLQAKEQLSKCQITIAEQEHSLIKHRNDAERFEYLTSQRLQEQEDQVETLKQEVTRVQAKYEEALTVQAEFAKQSQDLQMALEAAREEKAVVRWEDDAEVGRCGDCNKEFGLTRRKHHCRQCGRIFCADCISSVVKKEGTAPVKMCQPCRDNLRSVKRY
eukprot:Clim_evm32s232 gene=Clim_evmTU32s232